jgi:hypothetical protein
MELFDVKLGLSLITFLNRYGHNSNYDRNRDFRVNCARPGYNLRPILGHEVDYALRIQRHNWVVDSLRSQLRRGPWNRLQLASHINMWNRWVLGSDINYSASLHGNRLLVLELRKVL